MWPALENLGGLLYFIREKIMEFMEVVRKTEVKPCAYFLDGKRVSKSKYEYFYGIANSLGRCCDCLHTTQTKTTWQYRSSGKI